MPISARRSWLMMLVALAVVTSSGCADGMFRQPEVPAADRVPIPTLPPLDPDQPLEDGINSGALDGAPDFDGGCLWILEDDEIPTSVVWPPGYTAAFDPPRLVDPDGEVVATQGDLVEVFGGFLPEHADRGDRCLVDPDRVYSAHGVQRLE